MPFLVFVFYGVYVGKKCSSPIHMIPTKVISIEPIFLKTTLLQFLVPYCLYSIDNIDFTKYLYTFE